MHKLLIINQKGNEMKKCNCGSTEFIRKKGSYEIWELNKNGVLEYQKDEMPEINDEPFICRDCGETYNEMDFEDF